MVSPKEIPTTNTINQQKGKKVNFKNNFGLAISMAKIFY
jgi:hypothetical protein